MRSIVKASLLAAGLFLAACPGPKGDTGQQGPDGPPGPQGPMPVVATNAGLVGNGASSQPIAADFDTNGSSAKVARADHQHHPALLSASTTSNTALTSTIWADITTVATFTDRFSNDIARSNSTFTFTRGGTYLVHFSLNSCSSGQYVAYRLRRITGTQTTLIQRTNYSVNSGCIQDGLDGLFQVAAGDAVALQYVLKGGTNGSWGASNPLDGESMVTGQIDLLQVD